MRRLSILLASALLPAFAQASAWTLEYAGELTDRRTEGYEVPETLSGTLTFDLDNALDVSYLSWQSVYEIKSTGASDFVTGYQPTETGLNFDSVIFYNGDDPVNPEPSTDGFSVVDSYYSDGYVHDFYVFVQPPVASWMDDPSPKGFEFGRDDLYAYPFISDILIFEGSAVLNSEGRIDTINSYKEAYYDLTYAKLSEVTTPVPEPGTLFLMLAGLLPLWMFKTVPAAHITAVNKKRA